jgi:flagellar basal-body rod protein FlgB
MADMMFDKTTAVLAKVLDGTATRQRVLADNLANVDTPHYTRRDLNFEGELRDRMSQSTTDPDTHIRAIEEMALHVEDDTASPYRVDGNNVDIEREMVEVAKNSLQYESAAQLLSMKIRGLRSAISEGKK